MKNYTGVGSRETPSRVLADMTRIAQTLAGEGYTLRSGAAPGADTAFEAGAGAAKVIYLPWAGFNEHRSPYHVVSPAALALGARLHPEWAKLSRSGQLLHGRNGYQVLGLDLKSPSEFVICWTSQGKRRGGTAQAIRIAEAYDVPVYNLAAWSTKAVLDRVLNARYIQASRATATP